MYRQIARLIFFSKTGAIELKTFQLPTRRLGLSSLVFQTEGDTETRSKDSKDRSQIIPVETSIAYMKSDAYKITYGHDPVWKQYRRNHKGAFAPLKTRKTCIRAGVISAGNPCPICRDEYLVLDYKNTELLKQFISPYSGDILTYSKTGLCQKQHLKLLIAIKQAKDYGLISFDVPFRIYDYSEYYPVKQ